MNDISDEQALVEKYNYPIFSKAHYQPWMRFDVSPPILQRAPDFPLWKLEDGSEMPLSAVWSAHKFTIVEFGSFT